MWALANRTPFAADRIWLRDRSGAHLWVVAVKATFDMTDDGGLHLADEQRPPLLAPEYEGEPGASSLRYEADLGVPKPTTDILVRAHAHAPRGRPAPTVPVTLRVGSLRKDLLVHGPRVFHVAAGGVQPSRPEPFVTQPIRYELAAGGADTSDPDTRKHAYDRHNPIGCGFARDRRRLVGHRAPSVEYPPGDAPAGPAGLGPISSFWSPRLEYAGTYDAAWEATKKPLLPDDFDDRFAQCAPADQWSPRPVRGGEHVQLVNVTPSGDLRLTLPRIDLAFCSRLGRRRVPHESRMATLILEPDDRRVTIVWQSSLRVGAPEVDYLDETSIEQEATP